MQAAFTWKSLGLRRGVIVSGWAYIPTSPDYRFTLKISIDNNEPQIVIADQRREDLIELGMGDGYYGFKHVLNINILEGGRHTLRVIDSLSEKELPGSPCIISLTESIDLGQIVVNPRNIKKLSTSLCKGVVDSLLVDTNDSCNADCIYCPNLRSSKLIDLDVFKNFIQECIHSVNYFQFGCGQEPMLDRRILGFFEALHNSHLQPGKVSMITNGTLLSKHKIDEMVHFGLNEIQVSIDTINPTINNSTRLATDINCIMESLRVLHHKNPGLKLVFSVTVNSLSIHSLTELFNFGQSINVSQYYIREIFDRLHLGETSRRDDYRVCMQKLRLRPGEFEQVQKHLLQHPEASKMKFISSKYADVGLTK